MGGWHHPSGSQPVLMKGLMVGVNFVLGNFPERTVEHRRDWESRFSAVFRFICRSAPRQNHEWFGDLTCKVYFMRFHISLIVQLDLHCCSPAHELRKTWNLFFSAHAIWITQFGHLWTQLLGDQWMVYHGSAAISRLISENGSSKLYIYRASQDYYLHGS